MYIFWANHTRNNTNAIVRSALEEEYRIAGMRKSFPEEVLYDLSYAGWDDKGKCLRQNGA